jgi:hypothetical protein
MTAGLSRSDPSRPDRVKSPPPPSPSNAGDTGGPEPVGGGQAVPTAPSPGLKSRIDPKDLLVDWDTDGIADADDTGPDARLGKPPRSDFVRAHPTFKVGAHLLDVTDTYGMDAVYILSRPVAEKLLDEDEAIQAVDIYLLVARGGGYVFWPIKLGDPTGPRKPSPYVRAVTAAVEAAREGWTRIYWKGSGQNAGYRTRSTRTEVPDPAWPPDPMALYLDTVKDHYIDDINDPLIRKLRGEV